jgi:endonuclease/exonuclease/phosphatase (EEP) superfamily protein YafD
MFSALATYLPEWRGGEKKRRIAVLAVALLMDSWPVAASYLPPRWHPRTGESQPPIRLLQFNTWLENEDTAEVLTLIRTEKPDVVALQEATESLRAAITHSLMDRYQILIAGAEMILIRRNAPSIELRGWTRHHVPGGEAIEAQLGITGQEVMVLNLHAMAPLSPARAATRDAQFEWIARWCREQSGRVIVLGDLNTTPWSCSFGRLLRDGDLIDSMRGFGVQPTWRTSFGPLRGMLLWPIQIPIDHCLHSPGLIAVARETGPPCGSNHYPLLVTLRLSETAGR